MASEDVVLGLEVGKLILQAFFAWSREKNLTDEQLDTLLQSERARFIRNVSQPLPDV